MRPIVELGRSRYTSCSSVRTSGACFKALVPALLEEKVLSGEAVENLCAHAIANLKESTSFSAGPCADGAVAYSATQEEGTGDAGLLGPPPGGRPPSDPESLTEVSSGGSSGGRGRSDLRGPS